MSSAFGGLVNANTRRELLVALGVLRPIDAAEFPQDRDAGPRWPDPAATLESRSRARRRPVGQIGDHDLPGRGTAASGHVRPEAAGSQRDRRPVAADRDQRSGLRDLRSLSAVGKKGRQAGPDPFARGESVRPRRDPGLQRTSSKEADARRGLAAVRFGRRPPARGRQRWRRRRS